MSYRLAIGTGVALTSVALMATELILTRIFSVVVWYHFAFFAISVALFGTGTAAVLLQLGHRAVPEKMTDVWLARLATLLALSIGIVDMVFVNVSPDWFAGQSQFTTMTVRLLFTFLLAAAPFFVGGLVLCLAMMRYGEHAHRLYFWDLGGAALACVVAVPLLSMLGGPGALMFAGAFAALGAGAFALAVDVGRGRHLVLAGVALAVTATLGVVGPRSGWLEVRVAKGFDLGKTPPELHRWNAFSTVAVFGDQGFEGWGMSPAYDGGFPEQKTLVIDMSALTPLTRFDGSLDSVRHVLFDLGALVWGIRPPGDSACIIGAGGGKDVLAALAGGAARVTAVEINPLIVDDVMRGRFKSFVGDLYGRSDVDVHVADGRSFIRRTDERFDVILLSMVDTSAATAAGAYALTENSLYTTDAFHDFMDRLAPGGVLSVSTASLEGLAVGARLATMARAVLRERGRDPTRSIAIVDTPWLAQNGTTLHVLLIKPDGFTDAEVSTLERLSEERRFVPVYLPGRAIPPSGLEQAVIQAIIPFEDPIELERRLAGLPLDVTPVGDERPFFFYQNRLRDLPQALLTGGTSHLFGNGLVILAKVVVIAFVMTLLFLVVPIVFRRRELASGGGSAAIDVAFVASLGFGFMFLEIGALQRLSIFLGNPTYTLAVVLFVLLLSGALGSRLFGMLPPGRRAALVPIVTAGVALYALAFALLSDRVLDATASLSSEGRAFVSALLLLPVGLLMGVPFPSALSVVAARARTRIPWLFSINSATSVLGSALATLVALHAGIPYVLTVGAGFYVLSALFWLRMGRERAVREPLLVATAPEPTPQ